MLPPNVKLILSTLHTDDMDELAVIVEDEDQFIEVGELTSDESYEMIDLWLAQANRTITDSQRELIKDNIENNIVQPLYLKLIFDNIVQWRSYQKGSDLIPIQDHIGDCINQLHDRLERKHGGK